MPFRSVPPLPSLLPVLLALLLLAGCAGDRREEAACRTVLETLVEAPQAVLRLEAASREEVRLSWRNADGGQAHVLACRFAPAGFAEKEVLLLDVIVDGAALRPISLWMLRRVTGLPAPPDAEPPESPARAAAYALQLVIDGLSLGAVIALVATGYSLVYGITGTIQLAYGDIYMIGAMVLVLLVYVAVACGVAPGPVAILLALPPAAAVTALWGRQTARLVYAPLRRSPPVNGLVAGVGLSIALREMVRLAQGSRHKWLPQVLQERFVVATGGGFDVWVKASQVLALAAAGLFGLGLAGLVLGTRWGRVYRACSDDPRMAELLGADLAGTIGAAFALGATMAALAGAVVTLHYGEADFFMGFLMGFKALTAAMLGGIGSVGGALAGGLALGLFESLWAGYFGSAYKDVMVFGLLVLVLVIRPEGLLGRARPAL